MAEATTAAVARQHRLEVKKGGRFEFGRNWSRFLSSLNERRIALAEASLREYLNTDKLSGLRFLDVGSGSGLFSLAACRLGATVHSFDYDPRSVACTEELRRRYFNGEPRWTVDIGSALDRAYMRSLGTFDIVYSWGVLHHTGQMWQALENVKSLVALDGRLFIAIYNDLGPITDEWAKVKEKYCSLPGPFAFLFALQIVCREEWKDLSHQIRNKSIGRWLYRWRHYDEISTRGMSQWHDWIDWIGGFPYERATVEEIVDFYGQDGFKLIKLGDMSNGYGCNQFVFRREAPAGVLVDNSIPGSKSLARRVGHRVLGPFERDANSDWTGVAADVPGAPETYGLFLIRDDRFVGQVTASADDRIRVAAASEDGAALEEAKFHVVAARHFALEPPFHHQRGYMWAVLATQLAELGDCNEVPRRSPIYLFEDDQPLELSHAMHDDIDREGCGRFSHWGQWIYFSTSDNSDPNKNGRSYSVIVPF